MESMDTVFEELPEVAALPGDESVSSWAYPQSIIYALTAFSPPEKPHALRQSPA